MPDILLATLNAKFIHAAFGLRYLLANLGELQPRAAIAEFDINQKPVEIAEVILARDPRIVGLGVYIWNVRATTEVIGILKRVRPDLVIVLGGPEVSHETEEQEIVALADHVITGERRLDAQSLQGKGPVGVARLARQLGKQIVGVAGSVDDSAELRAQFDLLIGIKPAAMPLDEAMRRTGELLESAVRAHAAPLRALSS